MQGKLTISQPGDQQEQEADRVANSVVNQINNPQNTYLAKVEMPQQEEQVQSKLISPALQREDMPQQEEQVQSKLISPALQREDMPQQEEQVQALRESDSALTQSSSDLETSINQSRGGGDSLAAKIKQPMEQAFGADFSGVRVHTDSRSDQLNRSIQALAFTTGQDIFFRQGAYDINSQSGQKLIAHELTHVVQQNGSQVQAKQKKNDNNLIVQKMDEQTPENENNSENVPDMTETERLLTEDIGIDRSLAARNPHDILSHLMLKFTNIGFTYTSQYGKGGNFLLEGGRTGDCGTLAGALKIIAENRFGIEGIELTSIREQFLINERMPAPYDGGTPNCDDGTKWFFSSHTWLTYGGTVYDVLFQTNQLADMDKVSGGVQQSLFMPDGKYWQTQNGKIVYGTGDNQYSTVPLSLYKKLSNLIYNLDPPLVKPLVKQINSLFQKNDVSALESLPSDISHLRQET